MKKTTAYFLICLTSIGTAFANPHEWTNRSGMGLSEYMIKDHENHKIKISCNTSAGNNFDHYVTFYNGHNIYQNTDSKFPLSFLFNDSIQVSPLGTTKWQNGATAWNTFKNQIATARKIEVFVDNHQIAVFYPDQRSILNIAQEIKGCEALL